MFAIMSGQAWQAIIGQTVLFVTVSIVNAPSFATYIEMLKSSVRYSGGALGNNATNMMLGGTAPFIATGLLQHDGAGRLFRRLLGHHLHRHHDDQGNQERRSEQDWLKANPTLNRWSAQNAGGAKCLTRKLLKKHARIHK